MPLLSLIDVVFDTIFLLFYYMNWWMKCITLMHCTFNVVIVITIHWKKNPESVFPHGIVVVLTLFNHAFAMLLICSGTIVIILIHILPPQTTFGEHIFNVFEGCWIAIINFSMIDWCCVLSIWLVFHLIHGSCFCCISAWRKTFCYAYQRVSLEGLRLIYLS